MNTIATLSPAVLFVAAMAISSAILCGLFFVFSNFAMKALSRLPAGSAASAMQSINAAILNPGFFGLFAGTAAGSLAVLVAALGDLGHPASPWVASAAALCLAGCYLVTAAVNVPLNHRLDAVDPAASEAAGAWREYVARWLPWNHIRTVATLIAAVLYAVGALVMVSGGR